MCRVDERIYISADGHRSKFEEAFPCDKAPRGRLCSKVKRRTTEYYPKKGTMSSRDDTPSPINPPTPTGTGTYLTQPRRPSGTVARPSTRDGQKAIKPEIIIEFGSKKSKGTKYPSVSVSTGTYKRSSLGASSVGSGDIAVESPGSDASHTIRTGFPEAPLPPSATFGHSDGYIPTPTTPHAHHHRHTSSTSSFTNSSRTPSLYITSDPDYDSPTSHRTARYPPTIVHNPSGVVPSSPSRNQTGATVGSYRTTVITPQEFSQEGRTPDGLFPLDYAEFADRSASSHASSGAPEITRRGKDRDERRKKKEEDRKRQEELDRQVAEEMAKEENVKQVRFELGRAEARAQERAEKAYAEKEKERAEDREEARRRSQKEREKREREEQAVRDRKKEKSKPPVNDFTKRPAGARRGSMTQAQIEEQRRLLAAEGLAMQGERELAEAREREERLQASRQQQETPGYWDPRGGDRSLSNTTSAIGRRNSISRRNSVSSAAPPSGLSRSTSNRRPNVIQPNPPAIITQVPQNYAARPPSARQNGPPISFPANFNQDYNRPPSARRPSYSQQENPFAAPPTRGSGSSLENPFAPAPSVLSPSSVVHDPWDARAMQDALPSTRQKSDGRYTMQKRGEAVINRSTTHDRAQQATRAMGRAAGFEDDYETDSEDDRAPSYPPRSGLSGKGKKKY
ncbi:Nn.00g021280.m01.CDS01 [Neocucurbitaria sp. VM-36]